jgi:hypothetical protein
MDGNLWDRVYHTVMTIHHPDPDRRRTYDDRVIVVVALRATAADQAIGWACRPENWAGLRRPPALPSQPTMSRRLRTAGVQHLLAAVTAHLAALGPPAERVRAVDGRPLTINPFSKDPDARWGYALKGLGFGYKLHALWGGGPVPLAWAVEPLHASEATVAARQLVPALPAAVGRRYLVGDSAYDTNALYGAAAARGYQLLAPPQRAGRGLGHRVHHPARLAGLAGLARLRTAYGQRLYRQRARIDRPFGHWAVRGEGLDELPAHVRRLHRVRLYVHGKIILNGFRIVSQCQPLDPAA